MNFMDNQQFLLHIEAPGILHIFSSHSEHEENTTKIIWK